MSRNPFFLLSSSISSSSMESLSTRAMTSLGEWVVDCLSNSSSEFGRWIVCYASSSFSSLKWNWLISTSSDWREEAVSSLGTVASGRACWRGSSTGERSFLARKLGTETSIQASQRAPAFIAWPTFWNVFDRGSKSKIRWTACNYLSSLTNISDLSTLLRPVMLTRLSLGATCLLSAKNI